MAVGRGQRQRPQPGDPELAEVAVRGHEVAGAHRSVGRGGVAPGAEPVERVGAQRRDPAMATGVGPAGCGHERAAGVVELAVAEGRADVAGRAAGVADEAPQAAQRIRGVGACDGLGPGVGVAGGERVAQRIEPGAGRVEGLDEGGECLGDLHAQRFARRARVAERGAPQAGERRVGVEDGGQPPGVGADLARVGERAQHEGPQRVGAAVPAEPVLQAGIEQALGVAIERAAVGPGRAGAAVGEAELGAVAVRAAPAPVGRGARIVEQPAAELDRRRIAGGAVGRVGTYRQRPGTVRDDRGQFVGVEAEREGGARQRSRRGPQRVWCSAARDD